ncbi:MAG: GntR family transcriptional regulator [Verrucomicrobiota bacterium]
MLPFTIQLKPGKPVFEQLIEAFHRALASGQLRDGDPFPSVRALSRELKISPTTAHKVVAHLKDRGFLASRPGVGMQVTAHTLPDKNARLQLLEKDVEALLRQARDLNLTREDLKNFIDQHDS